MQALTGATAAEVGTGFKACTRTAAAFDYPADAPVIRFLDTRGLGEAGYDPTEDLAVAERQAHLLLVTMRAMDPAIDGLLAVVARGPATASGLAGAGRAHVSARGLSARGSGTCCLIRSMPTATALRPCPAISRAVSRGSGPRSPSCLAVARLATLRSTSPRLTTGMEPRLYGLAALHEAIVPRRAGGDRRDARASTRLRHTMRSPRARTRIFSAMRRLRLPPMCCPVAGAVAVPGVQAKMLHSLAAIYGVDWDQRTIAEFAGALGTGVVVRTLTSFGARQLAKLIPVYGQTAGAAAAAAMSFATTYALGKAAVYYLGRKRLGLADTGDVADA